MMTMSTDNHTWIRDGQALGCIVLAPGAGEAEAFAAAELARYLEQISGVSLPIHHGLRERPQPAIVILDASRPANRYFLHDLPIEQLQHDGYLLQSVGEDLFIVSREPFGIVHGTYQYLSRVLGCGFHDYPPHGETIPSLQSVSHGPVSLLKNPRLAYRGMQMVYSIERLDWMAKNGFNWVRYGSDNDLDWWDRKLTEWAPLFRQRGIRLNFGHHIFQMILPPEHYLQDHPDYYPDGQPRPQFYWALDNPEVMEEVVWRLTHFLRRHPEIEKLDFWPSDGRAMFSDEEYQALTGEPLPPEGDWVSTCRAHVQHGRLGDPRKEHIYSLLCKQVGEALQADFPHLEIVACAYSDAISVAPQVQLPPNVTCTVATFWRCYSHSYFDSDCVVNQQFRQAIEGWAERYPDRPLYLSEYYMGIGAHASLPLPILGLLFREWPGLLDLGIAGAKVNTGRVCATDVVAYNINYLAFQHLVWDDAETTEAFLDAYCRSFFGPVWRLVKEMYLRLEAAAQVAPHFPPSIMFIAEVLDEATLDDCLALIQQARDGVTDSSLCYRLDRLLKHLDYTRRAIPVSRLLGKTGRYRLGESPTDAYDADLVPLLEEMTEFVDDLLALDQDIIGQVKATDMVQAGDIKSKPSQWHRELAAILAAQTYDHDADPEAIGR